MALIRPGDSFLHNTSLMFVIGIYKSCDDCPEYATRPTRCKWTMGIWPRICIHDKLVPGRYVFCSTGGRHDEVKAKYYNALVAIKMMVENKCMKDAGARSNTYFRYSYASANYAIADENRNVVKLAKFPEDAFFEEYMPTIGFAAMIDTAMADHEKRFEASALELPWFVAWDEKEKLLRMWRKAESEEVGDERGLVAGDPLPIEEAYIMANWYEMKD